MEQTIGKRMIEENKIELDFSDYKNSIPTFLIHGNHDKPFGEANNGPLDILEKIGFVKYLGKSYDSMKLDIFPFIIKKDDLMLNVYPLSYIKDIRLNYLLKNNKVRFLDMNNNAFNILIVH